MALKACTNIQQIYRLEVVPKKMFPSGPLDIASSGLRFKRQSVLKLRVNIRNYFLLKVEPVRHFFNAMII